MRISLERLRAEAAETGFRAEVLEKAIHLLGLLEALQSHPYLKPRLALKGGTALNLFIFDLPRLSVDIDLNYVGAQDREVMLGERPQVDTAIRAVCDREGYQVQRAPDEHAGGKWQLRYDGALGQGGSVEVDLNYMLRVPLWPIVALNSAQLGSYAARQIRVVDLHEIAAGKLCALLSRQAARDLFDCHRLLTSGRLDLGRLRLAFVVYGGANRRDWRTVSAEDVVFDGKELQDSLIPMLRSGAMDGLGGIHDYARRLVAECRQAMSSILPFSDDERAFLDALLDHGEVRPALLTPEEGLGELISIHPALAWKALNVRQHMGIP